MYHTSELTLGRRKFFGKQNGAGKPQQSKLTFSTKPKPSKDEDKEVKDEPASSVEQSLKEEEVQGNAEAASDVQHQNGDAMEVDVDTASETGKKRSAKEEEEEDSDDEPPTKRQRRRPAKPSPEPKKRAGVGSKKADKSPPKGKKAAPPPKAKEDVDMDEEEEVSAPAKVAKGRKKEVEKSPTPTSSAPEEEDDEAIVSEEEAPEETAKAREKVQSTLKGKTRDPYPDWKAGEPVPYAALCTTFSKIEMTTKRLEILAHCSLFLRQVLRLTPGDLVPTVLLMINKLAADYAGIELGIGESLIMKAISESTGRNLKQIKADQNEIGDLGMVAAKSRSKQPTMFKPKALTVQGVHKGLMTIATIDGQGAQGRKVDGIKKLLSAADVATAGKAVDIEKDKGGASEAKYIVRTLEGKLRLGLADKTVLVALSQAVIFHEMEQKGKTPSTADLAKAESTLKSVYRYGEPRNFVASVANIHAVNCQATKSLFLRCSSMAFSTCLKTASCSQVYLSSLCLLNLQSPLPKS
jgi:DNA ligase-1